MSERWGFDLSMSAVRLLRREAGHWREIASQKLEGADIEARIQDLVDQVDPATPVDIFLPSDQILFTDVKITSELAASAEIDRAMDGRTPYALSELEIDWEITSPGIATVATIARETLDEAEDFATARGLKVNGFSCLCEPQDFPRLPDFGGGAVDYLAETIDLEEIADAPTAPEAVAPDEPEAEITDDAPTFSSRRTSEPLPVAPVARSVDDVTPVVNVTDPTPVMNLPEQTLPPLDPGTPLPRQNATPRIRTDVGASTMASGAQSLTASAPIYTRKRDRAVPTPALAAVAAALSIGIAVIIWAILPTGAPQSSGVPQATVPDQTANDIANNGVELPSAETIADALDSTPPTTNVLDLALETAPTQSERPTTPAENTNLVQNRSIAALPLVSVPTPPMPLQPPAQRPAELADIDSFVPTPPSANGLPLAETNDNIALAEISPVSFAPSRATLPASNQGVAPRVDTIPPDALPIATATPEEDATESDVEVAALDPNIEVESSLEAAPALIEPDAPSEADIAEDAEELEIAPSEPAAAALVPTELARALTDRAPRARPSGFVEQVERDRFGGRTRAQLAAIRPGARPASEQIEALVARANTPPSALAVATSMEPPAKPQDFDAIVASTRIQQQSARQAAALAAQVPDTTAAIEAALAEDLAAEEEATRPQNSPRLAIPSTASVARQATLEDAIRLNRINLVGVYGLSSDRRALVRLPSGRYVKVKVGDRVDGGTVSAITESQLQYQKGGRTVALSMPQG